MVERIWLARLRASSAELPVRELYAGRGFGLAVRAAEQTDARLWVLSAGLGLVNAAQQVPCYGLTVSRGSSDSLHDRISSAFDPVGWFSAMLEGPFSKTWSDVFEPSGRILLALSCPYAKMIGPSLAALSSNDLARLRIFGASLRNVLPTELHPALMPYDGRLDSIFPGTRVDFAQRALFHFTNLAIDDGRHHDRDSDFAKVDATLREVRAPVSAHRPRRSDEEIIQLILAQTDLSRGASRVLRAIRQIEGVACEQSRFSRLYRAAIDRLTSA